MLKRQRYTKQFKEEALRLVSQEGVSSWESSLSLSESL